MWILIPSEIICTMSSSYLSKTHALGNYFNTLHYQESSLASANLVYCILVLHAIVAPGSVTPDSVTSGSVTSWTWWYPHCMAVTHVKPPLVALQQMSSHWQPPLLGLLYLCLVWMDAVSFQSHECACDNYCASRFGACGTCTNHFVWWVQSLV